MAKQPAPLTPAPGTRLPDGLTFEQARQIAWDDRIGRLCHAVINWGGVLGLGLVFYLVIREIAGKTTAFTLVLDAMARLSLSQWAAWTIAALFGGLNVLQMKMRRDLIKRYHPEREALEKRHDRNRSSSEPERRDDKRPGRR